MGTLGFVCPTIGREVDTGIEVDSLSFTSLYGEQLGCPECLEAHQLHPSDQSPWLVRPGAASSSGARVASGRFTPGTKSPEGSRKHP